MQTALSRIWTWAAMFISNNNNCYAKYDSNLFFLFTLFFILSSLSLLSVSFSLFTIYYSLLTIYRVRCKDISELFVMFISKLFQSLHFNQCSLLKYCDSCIIWNRILIFIVFIMIFQLMYFPVFLRSMSFLVISQKLWAEFFISLSTFSFISLFFCCFFKICWL